MSNNRITPKLRGAVKQRAQNCCEYCCSQARFSMQPFAVEHVVPKSKGGKTAPENLAWSCQGCNNHKYNKTEAFDLISGEMVPLYNPRKQRWRTHFTWNYGCSLLVGLTAAGRATIEALYLNRKELVELRQVLYSVEKHPPKKFSKR